MKQYGLRALLLGIPLVAFNVLFFLIGGTKHPTSVWVAYVAIHLAFLFCVFTPLFYSKDDHPANAGVLAVLSLLFYTVQFVLGIVFILIAPESHTWVLVIEVVLFALFLIVFLVNAWGNSVTAAEERERVADKKTASDHSLRVKLLALGTKDAQLKKELMACYDRMMRTPMRNVPAVENLNIDIDAVLQKMERRDVDADTMTQLLQDLQRLVAQREETLKFAH